MSPGPRYGSQKPLKTTEKKLRPWPVSKALGVEGVKWRVWVGHQLSAWRRQADYGMMQKTACARSGLTQNRLSLIETGRRTVEIAELVALAKAYERPVDDIGRLYIPPTTEEWKQVVARHRPDQRFEAPPKAGRYYRAPGPKRGPGKARPSAKAGAARPRR